MVVQREDAPLKRQPGADALPRGSAAKWARLPFFGAARGSGCHAPWLLVGPAAWLCGDDAEPSAAPAVQHERGAPWQPGNDLERFFVRSEGTFGYYSLETAELGPFDGQLEPGMAVAVVATGAGPKGDPFGLTTHGLWIPLRDLMPIRPSHFAGVELLGGRRTGFVVSDSAAAYARPGQPMHPRTYHPRRTAVTPVERITHGSSGWWRLEEDGAFVKEADIAVSGDCTPPVEAAFGERWIDVAIGSQVLTLCEGSNPVFSTLVSTGRAAAGETATPLGVFRVWVKLMEQDMDNLDDPDAEERYGIEAVPWVMFFERGYGLHGTFWHDDFGTRRSHGCVNLSLRDARRVFDWAGPTVHPGWTAALPVPFDRGTLVRVRR